MTQYQTKVIDLYGGPGTGKSTSAAFLYYWLKSNGKSSELVREYVKNWAYDQRKISVYDQLYFLGKQSRNESLLYGKVDWIVTDSPVLLSKFYAEKYCPADIKLGIGQATDAFYKQAKTDGYQHYHLFLERSKPYLAEGRYQNEAEAKEIDTEIKAMLQRDGIEYETCSTVEDKLVTWIMEKCR